ncbi:MAG: flagellar protein FlaG [Acidaminococcales bacterium]|jgi:flagellar protein FlaG|nr:flagellar protein FlaG [Acidaminococcales bacterium]
MGSYSIDNSVAAQGRYANVVSAPKATERKREAVSPQRSVKLPKAENKDKIVEKDAKTAQNPVEKEKAGVFADEQKAKYEEIANDENKISAITETLNKFMAQWNAELQFEVHKDTSFLIVKFVDLKSHKVLKEFPPEEYLNMIANIRKYIGTMIDKKA